MCFARSRDEKPKKRGKLKVPRKLQQRAIRDLSAKDEDVERRQRNHPGDDEGQRVHGRGKGPERLNGAIQHSQLGGYRAQHIAPGRCAGVRCCWYAVVTRLARSLRRDAADSEEKRYRGSS